MLRRLEVKNFKAAQDLEVRLAPLTMLAGLNSSGKSTVLQSLALLRQSLVGRNLPRMLLHGPIVQLGTFGDVRTEMSLTDTIGFVTELSTGEVAAASFEAGSSDTYGMPRYITGDWALAVGGEFQFLHADRIVPKTLFPRSSDTSQIAGRLGARGEFTAEFLASPEAADFSVPAVRRAPPPPDSTSAVSLKVSPTPNLLDQVAGWLQFLSPGVRLSSDLLAGTDEARLLYDYVGREGFWETNKKIRPANVGFGLTYSLPIVVACLSAAPGSLLLIENPEAHLHPLGQFAMGDLLARSAHDGVQIVVETHSDHVLNGIRLAVKRQLLRPLDVATHYFTRDIRTGFASTESPAILPDGRLSSWPHGFFDQWDTALDALLEQ